MTFSRLISPPWMFFGECMTSCSTPSTRNRTRTSRSVGSMCTSEARSPTAWVMIAWTSLTIGASSRRRLDLFVVGLELLRGLRCKGFDLTVHAGELLDRLLDVGGGRHHRLHVAVRDRADVVERVDVGRVGHRDEELAVAFPDRDRPVAARERVRQQHRGRRVDLVVGQVDELQPDLLGQGADQVGLLDHPEIDQDAAERLGGLAMLLEGLLQLRSRDQTLFDQDLSELFRLSLDRSHVGLPASVRSRSSGTSFVITALDLKQARELFGQHDRIDLGVGVELHRSGARPQPFDPCVSVASSEPVPFSPSVSRADRIAVLHPGRSSRSDASLRRRHPRPRRRLGAGAIVSGRIPRVADDARHPRQLPHGRVGGRRRRPRRGSSATNAWPRRCPEPGASTSELPFVDCL